MRFFFHCQSLSLEKYSFWFPNKTTENDYVVMGYLIDFGVTRMTQVTLQKYKAFEQATTFRSGLRCLPQVIWVKTDAFRSLLRSVLRLKRERVHLFCNACYRCRF